MAHFFTHFWKIPPWRKHLNGRLIHTASNEFHKHGVRAGDFIYVVTLIGGKLHLGGRLCVDRFLTPAAARRRFGPGLWKAREHVVASAASATPFQGNLRVPAEVVRHLHFVSHISTRIKFEARGVIDRQALRTVRQLTPQSALLLDALLRDVISLPGEIGPATWVEGMRLSVQVDRLERSRQARDACVLRHGASCVVCGFNFRRFYGPAGNGFIHVHHLHPMKYAGGQAYRIEATRDLRPVCPNCHAMLHTKDPPLSIAALQRQIAAAGSAAAI